MATRKKISRSRALRAGGRRQWQIEIANSTHWAAPLSRLRRAAVEALRSEGAVGRVSVSVLLCGERRMQRLNQTYLRRQGLTDVIAFPSGEKPGAAKAGNRLLGDVAICVPVARRQARREGHSLAEEVCILLIHGVLHLLGYDDRSRQGAAEMTGKQRSLMRRLRGGAR